MIIILIIIIVIVILLIAIPYIPPPRVRHPGITRVGRVRWFPCRPHHRLESFMTYGSFMFSMLIYSNSNSQHMRLAMQKEQQQHAVADTSLRIQSLPHRQLFIDQAEASVATLIIFVIISGRSLSSSKSTSVSA